MQPKDEARFLAMKLRNQGFSYSEIQKIIPVSKASLSLWLRKVTLTQEQKSRLAHLSLKGQKVGAQAQHQKRLQKLSELQQEIKLEVSDLFSNPFFTMGLALYWAEGSKQKPWNLTTRVIFSNSDALMILLMRQWIEVFCGVDKNRFSYRLYIHTTQDYKKAQKQWAKILNIDPEKIAVTFKNNEVRKRHKTNDYKGLIQIIVRRSVWLNRRIELWTKELQKYLLTTPTPLF